MKKIILVLLFLLAFPTTAYGILSPSGWQYNPQVDTRTIFPARINAIPPTIVASSSIFINATTTNATTTNLNISGQLKNGTGTGCVAVAVGVFSVGPCTGSIGLALAGQLAFFNTTTSIMGTTSAPLWVNWLNATGTTASILPYASTTMVTATNASTTNLIVSSAGGATGCATFSAIGVLSNTGSACGSGGGGTFPFTPTTSFATAANSTSTLLLLTAGLSASSTVRFGDAGVAGFQFAGATGRLGLGTSTPGNTLSIHGSGGLYNGGNFFNAGAITSTSTSASTFPYASSTATTISGAGYFPGSGLWNSSGLGVGTNSITSTLTVNAGSVVGNMAQFKNGSTELFGFLRNSDVNLQFMMASRNVFQIANDQVIYGNDAAILNMQFRTQGVDRMFMNSVGVAVGASTTPSAQLSVQGNAYVSGNMFIGGRITSTSTPITNIGDITIHNSAASSTVYATSTSQSNISSWTSRRIPANTLQAGQQICLDVRGLYSAGLTSSVVVRALLGNGTATTTVAQLTTSGLANTSNQPFSGNIRMTIRSLGASGTVRADGNVMYGTGVAGTVSTDFLGNTGTIDTTANLYPDITIQWDSANTNRIVIISSAGVDVDCNN